MANDNPNRTPPRGSEKKPTDKTSVGSNFRRPAFWRPIGGDQ